MIFVIDDDEVMAECVARAIGGETEIYSNAIDAMNEISSGKIPEMIFLDILLDGPDGFTFLNELISYTDTARIPVVIVSSLDFNKRDLLTYGIVEVLSKENMKPTDIKRIVGKYAGQGY